MMSLTGKNNVLYGCMALALIIHGSVFFFTFEQTYDAYVHMFFASHYAEGWFEIWNPKWYTGFTITSYPPLVHQIVALLSFLVGLKLGFFIWSLAVILLFVRGVYHFSALFVPEEAMKFVALAAVFSFSFTEALHVFGQLPSLTGVSLLLNACPFIYKWFRRKRHRDLIAALALLALTTCAHHVTTIFGMVFFVLPVIGLALIDNTAGEAGIQKMRISQFFKTVFKEIIPVGGFGLAVILITLVVILPYWLWSKADPISQIPIPHGSRENFLAEPNLGIVFFLIPWGMMLFALPYLFHKFYSRRRIFFGLSFSLLFVLGTGGTTPIPRMILGNNAYDILTLDRFTFWASVMALPFWGMLFYELYEGGLLKYWSLRGKAYVARASFIFLSAGTLLLTGLIINLSNLKPMQPDKIDIVPIVNFLDRDDHDKWRYLTLGFGDQMAWLSANTKAQTVDGNYHSVRRLPELTNRAIERLENAKYLGLEGLGALQQFLTIPQYFYLKYIFANDKFYEPLLYFTGWKRIGALENGIVVWEKPDVPFLPKLLPVKDIPKYQKWIWGVFPLGIFTVVGLIYMFMFKSRRIPFYCPHIPYLSKSFFAYRTIPWINLVWMSGLFLLMSSSFTIGAYQSLAQVSPKNTVERYFESIDFKNFASAYSLFVPEAFPDFEQYVLELSVNDGILASYAKLDSLDLDIEHVSSSRATVRAKAQWITALQAYPSEHVFYLEKIKSKWYIKPFVKDRKVPPETFLSQPEVTYRSQGRRSTAVQSNEDILDRPEAVLDEAHLVKSPEGYHVIGTLRNIDAIPAHITLEAELYDSTGNSMGRYALRDVGLHALLPNESTPFRIDFTERGWEQSSLRLKEDTSQVLPKGFAVFARTTATDETLYRHYGMEGLKCIGNGKLTGTLINYGTREITVPQVLIATRKKGSLNWVDRLYLEKGIRSRRSSDFEFMLPKVDEIEWLMEAGSAQRLVNGKDMNELDIDHTKLKDEFQQVSGCDSHDYSIKMNVFVNEVNR